jgi:hypothetical protein
LVETGRPELDDARGRARPNALRLALIYAALDPERLHLQFGCKTGSFDIQPVHVAGAVEVVNRSDKTIQWFLDQPKELSTEIAWEDVLKVRTAVNSNGERLAQEQLCKLFSHKTSEERARIASRAGLKLRQGKATGKGKPPHFWTW